tara:strand:- start:395 stop:1195 length:801 start_codon:yes stop_codon:yes gene_type:complete
MGRRDLRKVTQRKPKTKGAGDEFIDWTIKDLEKRWDRTSKGILKFKDQLLYGMDSTPHEVSQPKRRRIEDLPSQEERWEQEELEVQQALRAAELANEKELARTEPVESAVNIPPSDQDLKAGQRKMNHEKNKLKLDAQFYYGEQAYIDIDLNYNEPSYNNYYTMASVDNDSTADGSMLEVEGDDKQDFSLEREWEADRQGEIDAEEKQAKDDFLNKSNNAAMKSGKFDPDELWELQKRHRSGEWRNKSDVDTGKSITGKTFTKAGK